YDLYRGPNALEKFVDKLEVELAEIQADLSSPAEIIIEPGNYIAFNETIECHICKKPFIDPALEILQQFEKAKYQLLECKEWEAYIKKDHPKKKDAQKKYQQALSNLNRKVGPEEVSDIQSIAPDAEIEYMPEVDLEVPIHLQDFFADYPLAPEKQIVPKNWLSPYNERLVHDKEVGGGKYTSGEKLLQTLLPKKNYVVHYRALQTYMKFGMKVTKIHGALKFKQSPWMKDYIEENICKRKIAKANKEEFGVMYYKLKNNIVFGKQMENVRKHMRVELLCSDQDKKLKHLVSSPLYVGFKAFEGGVTTVHMLKICLKPKMYSVLLAGHDPNTPKTDEDFEKELEDEETRKSRGIKDWQKKHGMQKAKGVKKSVVKRKLRHDKFLEYFRTRKLTRHDMYGLCSYDHQIYLERVNKIGLNLYDNKHWILLDGIRTLPYGHWRIYAYKHIVASGISPEEAKKRAMM
ncbi:39842_t:CDS:2, partial [Gigaspora margarita]